MNMSRKNFWSPENRLDAMTELPEKITKKNKTLIKSFIDTLQTNVFDSFRNGLKRNLQTTTKLDYFIKL